ncbi:SDR family NAD(P)-dependent oxidoreductase [Jiangella ureilytica]|uniref:SDR family NAD(P)-dependent oxidoreductase n=1 Tax=Jiangella ureilytica TaxID=2530374 RepID=A0A4R4RQG7_9ACTN|nr:SDR family NAD(P)-dependent oxidoreductase [Jiangella ureilytica]TDC50723.1 SDR family NAD(P)-dependent oxidoreductase [Jiangella ureilytica]
MSPARTVLITGGTGSLGTATVRALGRRASGWHAVVTGRDRARTAARAAALADRSGLPVTPLVLNLESLDAVRAFAREWPGRELPPLHAVVCNAGTMVVTGTRRTADGHEVTFAVNHLAHFLLVELLRPHLVAPARIVMVASDTHDPARRHGFPPPRLASVSALAAAPGDGDGTDPREEGRRRYTTSKLCAVLLAYELDRRLDDPGTTVNAFDPGLMPGTGLARDYHPVFRFAWRYLMPAATVLPRNVHTTRTSGAALARLIDDPALDGVSGRYFRGRHEARSSEQSYDRVAAAELWHGSVALTAP